jgi:hypothetical protein
VNTEDEIEQLGRFEAAFMTGCPQLMIGLSGTPLAAAFTAVNGAVRTLASECKLRVGFVSFGRMGRDRSEVHVAVRTSMSELVLAVHSTPATGSAPA